MYRRIVAGTDLSATAGVATDRAAWLAGRLGAELQLVHAGSDPGGSVEGNPAEVLITETDELAADLLVVGSVGMRGARRFLLGSVPNNVSHHSVTDLLIVKTDPPSHEGPYRSLLVGTDGSDTAMRAVDAASALALALGVPATILCAYEPPQRGNWMPCARTLTIRSHSGTRIP
jgi:nucleotide-binding universal stress UspA family protein